MHLIRVRCAVKQLKQLRHSRQCFSTGPATEHLRAVPFTRSREEARSDYDAYHRSVVSYIPSLSPGIKEKFLPFWGVFCIAEVSIQSARLGYWESRYNFSTRRFEHVMNWRAVGFSPGDGPSWLHRYDANQEEEMQIYASYDYRRAYVNGVRCRRCFTGATRLTPEMVESPDRVRGLDEFRMSAKAALALAEKAVYRQAEAHANAVLLQMYPGAQRTGWIKLNLQLRDVMAAPIYVPVFIFENSYLTEVVRTFVHGARRDAVGGQRLYHAPLAAIGGGVAAAAFTYSATGSAPLGAFVVTATIAATMALLFPVLMLRFREWMRVREEAREVWRDWGQEYVSAYEMWEEHARKQQARREEERRQRFYEEAQWRRRFSEEEDGYGYQRTKRSQPRQEASGPSSDPKGYYARLGLQPGASESEIKAAFRALALKHHPDRHQDPKNKEKAKANFVKITEAYEVLRDPNKRKEYQGSWV